MDGPALNAYNYNGDTLWVSSLSGSGSSGDRGLKLLEPGFVCVGTTEENYEEYIQLTKTDNYGQVTAIGDKLISPINYVIRNYPNPFNPETTFSFNMPAYIENPTIEIFNINGEKIKIIDCCNPTSVIWNGTDNYCHSVSSGIYFYRLVGNNFISNPQKMTLIK